MHGQDLDGGHAERADVVDDLLDGEAAKGAAERLGDERVALGEPFGVQLVENRPLPGHAWALVAAPGEGGVDDAALGHEFRRAGLVVGQVPVAVAERVAVESRAPLDGADVGFGVRVEQQLVGVEAVTVGRVVGSVHAVGVDGAGAGVGEVTVPDLVGVFRQIEALDLLAALVVEDAELDPRRVGGEEGEVDAQAVPGGTERMRQAFQDAGGSHDIQHRSSARELSEAGDLVACPGAGPRVG